jgi:hypothetical protein
MPRAFRTPVVAAPRMSNDRYGRYLEAPDIQNLNEAAQSALNRDIRIFGPVFAAQVWTDLPAADTELFGLTVMRRPFDLVGVTDARLIVTPGAVLAEANATLRMQYTLDLTGATGWANIDGLATGALTAVQTVGGALRIDTATASVPNTGAFVAVAAAAKAPVLLRIVGNVPSTGAGTSDPTFHSLSIQIR